MQLLIATKNPGKFHEIKEALHGLSYEFVDLAKLRITNDCEEGFDSYEDNALAKARYYHKLSGLLTIADDSGIQVDALSGQLGVRTRRFAGKDATDEAWLDYFFASMNNVPEHKRGATFVCCIALFGIRVSKVFRGKTRGTISYALEAPIVSGIPLSSCFRPEGYDKVYSAMSVQEKLRVSHRGKAALQLKEYFTRMTSI